MNPDYWKKRWENGQIGFHNHEVHPLLASWLPGTSFKDESVLVPMCGKSLDLWHLAKRCRQVVGIEISELACRAFFEETKLPYTVHGTANGHRFISGNLELWCQDFFTSRLTTPFHIIYDRASLVALPEDMRPKYIHKLQPLIENGAQWALISFEYASDQDRFKGPPFSIPESHLSKLIPRARIELRQERILIPPAESKMGKNGVKEIREFMVVISQ